MVDSPIAVRYLETGNLSDLEGAALKDAPSCAAQSLRSPALANFSQEYSVDTAAAYAANCLLMQHAEINAHFWRARADLQSPDSKARESLFESLSAYQLVFIPGWNYRSARDDSGADLRRQRELLSSQGAEVMLVPIEEDGSIEDSAEVIAQTLEALGTERPIILISASSGGAATAHALGGPNARPHPQVVAWLNIGGVLGGVPYLDQADGVLFRAGIMAVSAIKGWPVENLETMSVANSMARMENTRVPEQITIVNLIAIPFLGDVSAIGNAFYLRMRRFGPNDGMTLITGPVMQGGHTLVALGEDHFFANTVDQDVMTLALTSSLLRATEVDRGDAPAFNP